jgi:FAD synthetase
MASNIIHPRQPKRNLPRSPQARPANRAKTVLAFGTFDLLHPGHKYYLERARALGDELVVIVARDETVRLFKKHYPIRDEETRLASVKSLKPVTRVVLGNLKFYYRVLDDFRPDVIALGYDQQHLTRDLRRELKKRRSGARVVRLGAYRSEEFKTSLLMKAMAEKISGEEKSKDKNVAVPSKA